jgi:Cu/Zn superoxide dismutase
MNPRLITRLFLATTLASGVALAQTTDSKKGESSKAAADAKAEAKAMSGDSKKADKADSKSSMSKGGRSVTVPLGEQNNSKERGTAKLTAEGNKTRIEVSLSGAPKGVSQPAHVHEGSCPNPDPKPKYPLANVVEGKSSTLVDASLDTLTSGKLAINVHKSADELKVYVACGDIKQR